LLIPSEIGKLSGQEGGLAPADFIDQNA
jgi:hypothetical protein